MREDAWLGEQLGCSAWTVEASDAAADLLEAGPGFFQARVAADDIARLARLERIGFRTVDVTVTLRREPDLAAPARSEHIRDARPGDEPAVTTIAERDYTVSRFHLDPEIPDAVARLIKRAWTANFFTGARGDRMLVAERDGEVTGFELVLDMPEAAVIDLIAVSAAVRGRGTGSALVSRLIETSPGRAVQAGTQVANIPAIRLYERLGFMVAQTQFVLHRHAGGRDAPAR